MRRWLAMLGVAAVCLGGSTAGGHETGIAPLVIGGTDTDGGALVVFRSDNDPVVVSPSTTIDGFVLYTAADPSFENPGAEGEVHAEHDGDHQPLPLVDGTEVTVEIVEAGDTVAMKLRGVTLDEAGASVVLGTMPDLHAHPEWQLTLREGETACQTVRFRIRAGSGYEPSEEYTVKVTNDPASCAVCGDADGSGAVTVTDGVATLRTAAGLAGGCAVAAACDVDGSGAVSVSDGVNVLRAAAGLSTTMTCPDL